MATNVPPVTPSVREYREQESHYVRRTVTFANGSFVMPASLPAGALITAALVLVEQAFTAGASLVLGSAPGGNDIAAAADRTLCWRSTQR